MNFAQWRLTAASTGLLVGALASGAFAQSPESAQAPAAIRIGVAPGEAQMGQGSDMQHDYATAIRNSIVLLMSGPAVEIVPLDSRIGLQLQAEATQKQCDYILYAKVDVKQQRKGGFGRMLRMAAPAAGLIGMAGAGGLGAAHAASIAATAAAQSAQDQAMNELAGFNGQIKSKDDVTVAYRLQATGQAEPRLQNALQAKATKDGEDVLTPLLLKAAEAVLVDVTNNR